MRIDITGVQVQSIGDPSGYLLQDVGYESSLLNHFDLACNSVGARWWVSTAGVPTFRRQLDTTSVPLKIGDTAAADISYTDVSLSWDTRNVVTSLKMNQHGYDPSTGNVSDYSVSYTADSSIRRWGLRASDIDTCLYTGGVHAVDLQRRAYELMSNLSEAVYNISAFSINVQSNPNALDRLELRSPVTVSYGSLSQSARVLSVTHTITPTRWLVDVTLNEIQAGPTFADLSGRFTGTFSDFNAAYSGKTFQQYDAAPIPGN